MMMAMVVMTVVVVLSLGRYDGADEEDEGNSR